MAEPTAKPDNGTATVKCPKCGHKFYYDPGWIKVSVTVGCPNPKCGYLIRVKKTEGG
ncbi:MAG: hypothetical protein ABSH11_01305 [Verrucomicrobiota bacterium]|jgi:DNA-directed RNA polymerase subunit RPC12/RpoP